MNIQDRIKKCLLIEKMNQQRSYSKKIGLENTSKYHGKLTNSKEETIC